MNWAEIKIYISIWDKSRFALAIAVGLPRRKFYLYTFCKTFKLCLLMFTISWAYWLFFCLFSTIDFVEQISQLNQVELLDRKREWEASKLYRIILGKLDTIFIIIDLNAFYCCLFCVLCWFCFCFIVGGLFWLLVNVAYFLFVYLLTFVDLYCMLFGFRWMTTNQKKN